MKRNRRQRAPVLIPVASMGDIAFLLITFFIIVSEFANDPPKDVEAAKSKDIEIIEDVPEVIVTFDKDYKLYVDADEVDEGSLGSILTALAQEAPEDESARFIFRADKNIPYDKFEPVLEIIAKAGDVKVSLTGDEDKTEPGEAGENEDAQ